MKAEVRGKPAFTFNHLPRGGTLVEGDGLRLQIGVKVRQATEESLLGPGAFLGQFGRTLEVEQHGWEAQAHTELRLFKISVRDRRDFFHSNPGTFVRLSKHSGRDTASGRTPLMGGSPSDSQGARSV